MVSSVSAHTVGVGMKTILEASTDVRQEEHQDLDRFKAKEVKEENFKREVKLLQDEQKKVNQVQNEGMSSATTPQGNALGGALREAAGLHYQMLIKGTLERPRFTRGIHFTPNKAKCTNQATNKHPP